MVYILIVAGIFFLDFGIKHYVDTHRDLKEKTPVLNGKIIIRKYYNKGAALNFLEKQPQVMRKIQTVLMAAVGGSFLILLPKREWWGKRQHLVLFLAVVPVIYMIVTKKDMLWTISVFIRNGSVFPILFLIYQIFSFFWVLRYYFFPV